VSIDVRPESDSEVRARGNKTTPLPPGAFGLDHVPTASAWLLRTSRLLGSAAEYSSVSRFAAAFRGGTCPTSLDASRVSRTETGALPLNYRVVRRYEELLGRTPGQLVTPLDTLNRFFGAEPVSAPRLARPASPLDPAGHAHLAGIVERVRYDDIVTGQDWDDLTGFLATRPDAVLLHPCGPQELADRLLAEMIVADGLSWAQRYEAFSRMLGHPVFQAAAVEACGNLAADRSNQVFVDTLSILDASTHPDSVRHLTNQIVDPVNDRAFLGALLGCIRKARRGDFDPDHARTVAGVLIDLVNDAAAPAEIRRLASDVLDPWRRVPRTHPGDRSFASASAASQLGAALHQRVLGSDLPGLAHLHDPVLPVLLEQVLSHPHLDARLSISLLLHASPYRAVVADAAARELERPAVRVDDQVAGPLLGLVRLLGSAEHAAVVQGLVTDTTVEPGVREAAAFALGHVDVGASDPFWRQAVDLHATEWARRRDQTSSTMLSGLVYSMGVLGHEQLLRDVRSGTSPAPARRAAGWWANLSTAVTASVRA